MLVALPSEAVGGPDGFMIGFHVLSSRLGVEWLIAPVALLVGLNAVSGAAAYLSSTSRLPFVAGMDLLPSARVRMHCTRAIGRRGWRSARMVWPG